MKKGTGAYAQQPRGDTGLARTATSLSMTQHGQEIHPLRKALGGMTKLVKPEANAKLALNHTRENFS